jgi:hypothetical protein
MTLPQACCRVGLLVCCLTAVARPGCAADLKGTVRDYAAPDGAGLGGVEIAVLQNGQVVKTGGSDALGSYVLRDLPPKVPLVIQYTLAGYVQRPTKRSVKLGTQGETVDVNLLREAGSNDYYDQVASSLKARSVRNGSSLEKEWKDLAELRLSSDKQAMLLQSLTAALGGQAVHQLVKTTPFGYDHRPIELTAPGGPP